ncbi:condensation domain-containing protein, partial [Microbulbifer epialgicus]
FNEGRENPLGPLSVQYADYAVWQREWLSSGELEKGIRYWKKQLKHLPELHNLKLDKIRPKKQRFIGKVVQRRISLSTFDQIRRLCGEHNVTLFMFMQTVFSILLSRYSGDNDIVIGTATAGRLHRSVESLIGFFVNDLILRTDLSGDPEFISLLNSNKKMVLDAYSYHHIPFENIVDVINPERNTGFNPGYQIKIDVQNNEQQSLSLSELSLEGIDEFQESSKYDIHLNVLENEEGMLLRLSYSTDLFLAETANRLIDNLLVLIDSILSTPNQRISQLKLLSGLERRQLLTDWNNTQADYADKYCIHEVFE